VDEEVKEGEGKERKSFSDFEESDESN